MHGGRVIIYPLCRRGAHCAPENTMPLAAPLRRAREGELPRDFVGRDDLGAPCMPNHNGIFAAMRRRHTRGETRSFSPLANHPVSFWVRAGIWVSAQRLAAFAAANKGALRAQKQVPLSTCRPLTPSNKKGRFHTTGALRFPSRRGAHRAPASGAASVPLTLPEQPGGSRKAALILARAARPVGEGGDSQEAGGT